MGFNMGRAAYAWSEQEKERVRAELQVMKETAIEEVREQSRLRSEQSRDAYLNSPQRREMLRGESVKDLDAKSAADLRTRITEATSPELVGAKIASENAVTTGTADARAAAEAKVTRAKSENLPYELSPGGQRFVGSTKVAENERRTNGEISGDLYREGLKTSGSSSKVERMSEAGRIQLQGLQADERDLDKQWQTAIFNDSTLKEDGSDQRHAAYLKRKQAIGIQKMRVLAQEGAIDGAEDAQRALDGEKSPEVLQRAKQQASMVGGQYGKDFGAAIDQALQQMGTPEAKRAAIEADMRRTGTKDALIDIDGQRTSTGKALWGAKPAKKPSLMAAESSAAGKALDEARSTVQEAKRAYQAFGSRQRQTDPRGFAQAKAAYEEALAQLGSVEREYAESFTGTEIPAMRPQP